MIRLFLRKKRKSLKLYDQNDSFLWIFSAVFLSMGIMCAFLFPKTMLYVKPSSAISESTLFHFALLKNNILLTLLLFNAFSLLGFPFTAMLLFCCGYIISNASIQLFFSQNISKFKFLLYTFPHIAMQIAMYFFLSKAVLLYTQRMFLFIQSKYSKKTLKSDTTHLFAIFILSLLISVLSAAYEAYIL